MTILLIHPYFLAEDPAELRIMKPYPPLGLMYLSAWLKGEGIPPVIFDGTFSGRARLRETLLQLTPGIAPPPHRTCRYRTWRAGYPSLCSRVSRIGRRLCYTRRGRSSAYEAFQGY